MPLGSELALLADLCDAFARLDRKKAAGNLANA